ncbi:hypothetical protein DENSPDRAFT_667668 [Dentipellis sp. KUC8613]|nr:hypothetical protein DENSPDRAFT_667668 [Dentipellis sp. KUC8613]
MPPLPLHTHTDAVHNEIYTYVLQAEQQASRRLAEQNRSATADLVYARVIGYLLLYPFGSERAPFIDELLSCRGKEESIATIYSLGKLYVTRIIALFNPRRSHAYETSGHLSEYSFERLRLDTVVHLQHGPRDHKNAKAQVRLTFVCASPSSSYHTSIMVRLNPTFMEALIRDDYRCMITGKIDGHSYARGLLPLPPEKGTTITACCHIIPEFLGLHGAQSHTTNKTYWTLLNRFGYTDIQHELTGNMIYRLENVLTLGLDLRVWFESLCLWFEAVEGETHCYHIRTVSPCYLVPPLPPQICFVAQNKLPLPCPKYLAIHAACCRIAHMSGATEYVGRVYREEEKLGVLATEGNSAYVLDMLLQDLAEPNPLP